MLRGMDQTKLDLGVFQESKVTDGINTHVSAGYGILTEDTPIYNHKGVAIFYRYVSHFQL